MTLRYVTNLKNIKTEAEKIQVKQIGLKMKVTDHRRQKEMNLLLKSLINLNLNQSLFLQILLRKRTFIIPSLSLSSILILTKILTMSRMPSMKALLNLKQIEKFKKISSSKILKNNR